MTLFYEAVFNVQKFPYRAGGWVFSFGDSTGNGFHGDFISGWDINLLSQAIKQCNVDNGGTIDECAPLKANANKAKAQACKPSKPGNDLMLPASECTDSIICNFCSAQRRLWCNQVHHCHARRQSSLGWHRSQAFVQLRAPGTNICQSELDPCSRIQDSRSKRSHGTLLEGRTHVAMSAVHLGAEFWPSSDWSFLCQYNSHDWRIVQYILL